MELLQKNKMEENIDSIKETILKYGQRAVDEFQGENVPSLTGERANNYLSLLAGFSALLEERQGELEILEATFMIQNRANYKSNADTELYWRGSEEGKEQIRINHLIKGVDKVCRACRDRLRQLQQESFNQQ
jgi:hypothetical protein